MIVNGDDHMSSESMSSPSSGAGINWKAWWQAARPPFYIATLVPMFLGFVAAYKHDNQVSIGLFGLILLASFLVHLATNLANDLFDHMQGVDAGPNIGGSRVMQEGKLSFKSISVVTAACYILALGLAFVIVHFSGQPKLWFLIVFAAFSSLFYVAPPIKYGHRALGELFVFINMGLIMTFGTYVALTGRWDIQVLALAVPVGLMVAGILYYQSLPEIITDRQAGKITLANALGKEGAALAYLAWWPLVWLLMINLWLCGLAAWPVALCVLSCPLHIMAYKKIKAADDWLELDRYGYLVRLLYLINGIILNVAVALN